MFVENHYTELVWAELDLRKRSSPSALRSEEVSVLIIKLYLFFLATQRETVQRFYESGLFDLWLSEMSLLTSSLTVNDKSRASRELIFFRLPLIFAAPFGFLNPPHLHPSNSVVESCFLLLPMFLTREPPRVGKRVRKRVRLLPLIMLTLGIPLPSLVALLFAVSSVSDPALSTLYL